MLTDYYVTDHSSPDYPDWVKSLVSSLYRGRRVSTVLPLTVVVEEIGEWVEFAAGEGAWSRKENRNSLLSDLDESVRVLGASLRARIAPSLRRFRDDLNQLSTGAKEMKEIRKQPPGTRTDVAWTAVAIAAKQLLGALDATEAAQASWDDLVATAQTRALESREYRPIADLLFDQLRRRGLDAERVFREVASLIAFGCDPGDPVSRSSNQPLQERLASARHHVSALAVIAPTVVWLGYQGKAGRQLSAGPVTFLDAHWAVPNAEPAGQDFEHKAELWELVRGGGCFEVARRAGETSAVDLLVRIELGDISETGAVDRAVRIANAIIDISVHDTGGSRLHLAQSGLLRSGRTTSFTHTATRREIGFPDDHIGAGVTAEAIERNAPRIALALAREELPRYLAAALEVQTIADHPFSRDMMMQVPSQTDIRSVIPLADRVVQNIAAHAALNPSKALAILRTHWPHARWRADVRHAVQMCLLGGGPHRELRHELVIAFYATDPSRPWILLAADRSDDLLKLCRIESERSWIGRMLASVRSNEGYRTLISYYTREGVVLEARRDRLRNALVHGNPAGFASVESVREYAMFLSRSALRIGIDSFVNGTEAASALEARSDEEVAMSAGQDAASYWIAHLDSRITSDVNTL